MLNNTPEISVILPFYNADDTLPTAIKSIQMQVYTDWELILVDDGSSDTSAEIARRFSTADDRIRLIQLPRSGIVTALNAGITTSRAPLIARMDSDDMSLPDRLGKQYNYLNAHPETGLVSCLIEFGGNQTTAGGYSHYVNWINSLTSHDEMYLNRFAESPVAHPSVMFRKEILEHTGSYRDGDFPEDYELWLRFFEHGVRFGKVPEQLLIWNDPPNRLSRTDSRYSVDAFYRIKARYLVQWLSKHNPQHPEVVILGSGRKTRKRVSILQEAGLTITHYVDVAPNKIGNILDGVPVISVDDVPEHSYIISMIGNRNAAGQVRQELQKRGRAEGVDFIIAA